MFRDALRRLAALLLALSALWGGSALAWFDNGDTGLGAGDQPIAQNLTLDTYRNVAVDGVLSGKSFSGDSVTYRVIRHPARGSLTFPKEGGPAFTYTPYENKTGKDRFTYVAEDSQGRGSQPAEVTVTITKPAVNVFYQDLAGHPAHKAAISLAEQGVFTGDRVGTASFFRPEQPVSRQEFLVMAMIAVGHRAESNSLPTGFVDNTDIAVWARPYVTVALREGTVQGRETESGISFQPDMSIKWSEAAVILNRLLGVTDTAEPESSAVPAWAGQSVANLETVGVLPPGGNLDAILTRGDAALLLDRALELMETRKLQ